MLKPAIIKYFGLLTGLIVIFFFHSTVVAQTQILKNDDIVVVYEPPLKNAAGEVIRIYPVLIQELKKIFGWHLDIRPQVILVKSNRSFRQMTRNDLFVAFAVPDKNLIVIDYSRMNTRPFSLRITFKHELCHLLLHRHINSGNLAKWLDEGVCQWVSDGIGEILLDRNWSGLDAAITAGHTLSLTGLTETFPGDKASLMLAYEQSKSVVAYIDRHYGQDAILNLLGHLKNGAGIETATLQSLSLSVDELEKEWLDYLERTPRWLIYLANNLYGILFFIAAILTVCGFFLRLIRKKRWEDEQEEDDWEV